MEREEIESIVKHFGFEGTEINAMHKENGIRYTFPRSGGYGSVIINGVDIFINDWEYLKIEIDDYGIVVRMYYDIHYIGCVVYSYDDIKCFVLKKGM